MRAAGAVLVPVLVLGGLLAAGCRRGPDLEHPKKFDEGGVAFSYPGNWKVAVQEQTPKAVTVRQISVESPGQALLTITEFTPAIAVEAKEFVDGYLRNMSGIVGKTRGVVTLEGIASQPIQRPLLGQARAGLRYRFRMAALGEKVPHSVDGYSVQLPGRTLVVLSQAPDDEVRLVEAAFARILDSLEVK